MQIAESSNLFIKGASSKSQYGFTQVELRQRFYQQLSPELVKRINGEYILEKLAKRLIILATSAHSLRKTQILEHASQFLINLPHSHPYASLGRYYQALSLSQHKQFNDAQIILERVVEKVLPQYQAKAILSLAATHFHQRNYEAALSFYLEAGKAAADRSVFDPFTLFTSQRMLAVIKSIDGDHRRALADLEKLYPMANSLRRWDGPLYCNFLNSYAVELHEVGQLHEASNIMSMVLASPFVNAYPEWRETGKDISLKGHRQSRSVVFFTKQIPNTTGNLVFLSERSRETSPQPDHFRQTAQVLSFHSWKKKMARESSRDVQDMREAEERKSLTTSERLINILSSLDSEMTDEDLDKIIDLIASIKAHRKSKN